MPLLMYHIFSLGILKQQKNQAQIKNISGFSLTEPKKPLASSIANPLINEEIGESISASSDSQINRRNTKTDSEIDDYSQNFESSSSVYNGSLHEGRINSVESEVIDEIEEINTESISESKSSLDKEVQEENFSSVSWASLRI